MNSKAARGSGMMTVKVSGDVGAVRAAVEAGKATALSYGALVSSDVIARPMKRRGLGFIHAQGEKERPNFYAACPEPDETEKPGPVAAETKPAPEKPRRTRRPRTAGKAKKSVTPATEAPAADTTAAETPSGHSSEDT